MFEFLKNILAGKPDGHQAGGTARVAPQTVPSSYAPVSKTPAVVTTVARPNIASSANPPPGSALSNGGSSVQLPLHAVLNGLPAEFQSKIRQSEAGNATITISLEQVLTQLPQGSVKIPFGEIPRQRYGSCPGAAAVE
jgi:hypothetical protein